MAGYNPSWLENMYMNRYPDKEDEEDKKTISGLNTVSAPYRTYQTESNESSGIPSDIMSGVSSAPNVTKEPDKATTGKLGAADYVGLGLQLVGAMNADKEAQRLEGKEDKKYSEAQKRAAQQREDELRQAQEQLQRQDRGMNMQGLDMLAQQRERAYSKRVSNSMANTFMKAMRG